MKKQVVDILGKKYRIQTNLSDTQMKRVTVDIGEKMLRLSSEYPSLDKIDILILSLVESMETLYEVKKSLEKKDAKLETAGRKLLVLESKINARIKKLDNA